MIALKIRKLENSRVFYFMIVIFCMNFLGRGSVFCLLFGLYSLLKMPIRLKIDGGVVLTFFLSLVAFVVSIFYYDIVEAIKSLNFVLMYLVAINGYYGSSNKVSFVKKTIFSIFLGYALLVVLTYISNFNEGFVEGQRLIKDFWKDDFVAVTLIGLLSSVVIGYSFYGLFCQKNKWIKLLTFFFVIVALLLNIQTATRTPIILFAIMMLFMTIVYLFSNRVGTALKVSGILLMIAIVAALIFDFDVFGVRTYITSTPLFERFLEEGTDTERTEIAKMHFQSMLDYPWGGNCISATVGHLAHNFLQQGHDMYGIFATIILLILSFSFVKNIFSLLLLKQKDGVDYLLISMYMAMLIQMFLEPVFTGYSCFFFSFLLIHGLTTAYLKNRNVALEYEKNENC